MIQTRIIVFNTATTKKGCRQKNKQTADKPKGRNPQLSGPPKTSRQTHPADDQEGYRQARDGRKQIDKGDDGAEKRKPGQRLNEVNGSRGNRAVEAAADEVSWQTPAEAGREPEDETEQNDGQGRPLRSA
jgi:hypothetical protein